eukprot:TRINITY_DN8725_c0_g1_i5.p1 TRINITY_DN8725_c0_g1~~TRINITY_DN8725_c0_g1_i5.p1  ORF type:complete len:531 (+),score=78.49 TRINITY_DN8725_c0_g1_i5:307-1899(+)
MDDVVLEQDTKAKVAACPLESTDVTRTPSEEPDQLPLVSIALSQGTAITEMPTAMTEIPSETPQDGTQNGRDKANTMCLSNSKLKRTGVLDAFRESWHDVGLNEIIQTVEGDYTANLRSYSVRTGTLQDRIHMFVEHPWFDLSCGGVILLNAAFMAYETEWALTTPVGTPMPVWMLILGKLFTTFFVFELLLRICGGLRRFFCTCNPWNYFDLIVVAFSVAEEVLQEIASKDGSGNLSNARMIRLLRLTRTVKVFRMIRIVRMIGALRTLVNSLVGTIKQVIWAFFLIICLMFVFAVIFGQVVSQARWADWEITDEDAMWLFWGNLSSCMYTLYLSVSGGVSWMEAAAPLTDLGSAVFLGFILYVALVQWVVLNVITGCFCESAAEAARKDVALAVHAHRTDRDKFLHRCKTIFRSIDKDGSGVLEVDELKPFMDSEPAHALFAALEIDIDDVHGLFELLDEDGTEFIDLEEFMFGCLRLRGGAKALDMARLQHQNKEMGKKLTLLLDRLNRNDPAQGRSVRKRTEVPDQ